MSLNILTARDALSLAKSNILLVDIREPDEFRRRHVPGSINLPLSQLRTTTLPKTKHDGILFFCASGNRTTMNAALLASLTGKEIFCVDGGLGTMAQAGFTIHEDRSQPIDIMRQVQIIAGSLIATGTALGVLVSNWFLVLPFLVGLGLTFAGISGFCGMAKLLQHMPWNKSSLPLARNAAE